MPDPRDDKNADETIGNPEPERIDTNEKADDIATVVNPDGTDVIEAIPSKQGRTG